MKVVVEHTWCLTDKGERVPETHPLARFLLVNKGCEIEEAQLNAYPVLDEQPHEDHHPADEDLFDESEHPEHAKRPRGRPPKHPKE